MAKKRKNLVSQNEVQLKRRRLESEWQRFRAEECMKFFQTLNDHQYMDRVKKTFQFIRNFRREKNQKGRKVYIPMTA